MKKLLSFSLLLLAAAAPLHANPATDKESGPLTTFEALKAGKKQTVITYGTSLTINGAWAVAVGDYFEKNYPGQVTFSNGAKAGMHSDWGVANFQERVLSKNPDLVFIEFSINDAAPKNHVPIEKSRENLDTMVKALKKQNPNVDIILQTMDMAWDSPAVPEKKYGSDRPELAAYYEVYRTYARENHLPLIDNQPTWEKILKEEPDRYHAMVPDGIHPASSASMEVTWVAVEALLEKTRAAVAAK